MNLHWLAPVLSKEAMMKKAIVAAFIVGVAASQTGAAQAALKVQPARMQCEDFLALADNDKPALLYWTAGADRTTVKTDDELVVDAAVPVGVVVDECRKDPKTSFVSKVHQLTRSGRLDVIDRHARH
jgi:acid stress chaperone HdeA